MDDGSSKLPSSRACGQKHPGADERLIEFDRPLQVVLITISINGSQAIWENIDLSCSRWPL
ncbi:MAG: hypothetical protein JRD88_03555 [Deltaproteobacteria bacterium]|nr:hypothetical protein [Deltaproteobacteria bacterium]